jgi:hypothetical protein
VTNLHTSTQNLSSACLVRFAFTLAALLTSAPSVYADTLTTYMNAVTVRVLCLPTEGELESGFGPVVAIGFPGDADGMSDLAALSTATMTEGVIGRLLPPPADSTCAARLIQVSEVFLMTGEGDGQRPRASMIGWSV